MKRQPERGSTPQKLPPCRLAKAEGRGDLHRPHPAFVNIGERDAQLLDELELITLPAGPADFSAALNVPCGPQSSAPGAG